MIKTVMLKFGDIEPFLRENTDIGPTTRPKLLSFFDDLQKQAFLQLELAATVDLGRAIFQGDILSRRRWSSGCWML